MTEPYQPALARTTHHGGGSSPASKLAGVRRVDLGVRLLCVSIAIPQALVAFWLDASPRARGYGLGLAHHGERLRSGPADDCEAETSETGSSEGEGEGELDGWDEDIDDEDEPSDDDDDDDEPSDDESEPSDDEGFEGLPNGASCVADSQCASQTCYLIPFIGGFCGECSSDLDCPSGGCSGPDPFAMEGSVCNLGELGGGCDSDDACMPGLECGIAFDLLGLITLATCSECLSDGYCLDGQICAPLVSIQDWSGARRCMSPGSLPQDAYCELTSNGDLACSSGICSVADVMGIAQMGACGECESDADCVGTCIPGQLDLQTGKLSGSICVDP